MRKLLILPFLLFVGCSTKYFEPKKVEKKELKEKITYNKTLIDYTDNTLTFEVKKENNCSLSKENVDLKGNRLGKFIKINRDLAIYQNKILIISNKNIFKVPFDVYSATKKGNKIAFVLKNNSFGILDIKSGKVDLFDEKPLISTRYIKAMPLFYEDLILYPLLDGRVAVVDSYSKRVLRYITVSSDEFNNNVIFLKIINNSLFMATSSKLILFNPNFAIDIKENIKYIVDDNNFLYLFTFDGKIIKIDTNLKVIKKVSLPFASFYEPAICNSNIYAIERGGYLVKISKNLDIKVYKVDGLELGEWDKLKIKDCKIYNSNKVFSIE